jgi:hypothetical protein
MANGHFPPKLVYAIPSQSFLLAIRLFAFAKQWKIFGSNSASVKAATARSAE